MASSYYIFIQYTIFGCKKSIPNTKIILQTSNYLQNKGIYGKFSIKLKIFEGICQLFKSILLW